MTQSPAKGETSAAIPPAPFHVHQEHHEDGNGLGGGVDSGRRGEAAESLNQSHDPGFVMHVAGVVGLSIIPGGVISADSGGRLLVRGPDKLIGKRANTNRLISQTAGYLKYDSSVGGCGPQPSCISEDLDSTLCPADPSRVRVRVRA